MSRNIQTAEEMSRNMQTAEEMSRIIYTAEEMSRNIQTAEKMSRNIQTAEEMSKNIQTAEEMFRNIQTVEIMSRMQKKHLCIKELPTLQQIVPVCQTQINTQLIFQESVQSGRFRNIDFTEGQQQQHIPKCLDEIIKVLKAE